MAELENDDPEVGPVQLNSAPHTDHLAHLCPSSVPLPAHLCPSSRCCVCRAPAPGSSGTDFDSVISHLQVDANSWRRSLRFSHQPPLSSHAVRIRFLYACRFQRPALERVCQCAGLGRESTLVLWLGENCVGWQRRCYLAPAFNSRKNYTPVLARTSCDIFPNILLQSPKVFEEHAAALRNREDKHIIFINFATLEDLTVILF